MSKHTLITIRVASVWGTCDRGPSPSWALGGGCPGLAWSRPAALPDGATGILWYSAALPWAVDCGGACSTPPQQWAVGFFLLTAALQAVGCGTPAVHCRTNRGAVKLRGTLPHGLGAVGSGLL